jgi:hypothetical protein
MEGMADSFPLHLQGCPAFFAEQLDAAMLHRDRKRLRLMG